MYAIDLSGKVALVTGGSRGLGRAMCLGLAQAGADIVVASRKREACEAVVAEVRALGRKAIAVAAHTGDTASLDALISTAQAEMGKVDILINNAGINPAFGGLSELAPEMFDKMVDVNLKGPWYLASRMAPEMAKTGGGCIVNVISVSALKPSAFMGFYAMTKAGLETLTKVMAAEWASQNIRVNALAPGTYLTDMVKNSFSIPGFEDATLSSNAQKRIADAEEIVGPLLYMVSDMGSYTTGSTIVADGGFMVS